MNTRIGKPSDRGEQKAQDSRGNIQEDAQMTLYSLQSIVDCISYSLVIKG